MSRTTLRLLAGTLLASLAVLASPFGAATASATTLSGALTVDNSFNAYLSNSASSLGTQVASGSNWQTAVSFSNVALTAGQSYFLNIEAYNAPGGGLNPGALLGTFSLSDASFQFANGLQTLQTGATGWTGGYNASGSLPQSWSQPTGSVVALGGNGTGPWGNIAGIGSTAQWIWPSDAQSSPSTPTAYGGECQDCVVDFQTQIQFGQAAPSSVPEPASMAIFAVALGGLAFALRRQRRPA